MADEKLGNSGLAKHEDIFPGIYRGKVLYNNDPNQYGRIKIQVYPMFTDITDHTLLPWAVPAYPIWEGSGSGIGYFAVPDVNTFVFVFFEQGDVYQPVYFAEAPTAGMGLPTDRTVNYPNRKVLKTNSGITIFVDDTAKHIRVNHPTGTYVLIDTTGKVQVVAVDNIDLNSSQDINITATKTVTITGGIAVKINP